MKPEIIDRLVNLTLTIIVLIFVYLFYQKVVKNKIISGLTVVLTAFTPLFLQKAHTINFDVFLLLGWLGYSFFFDRFYLSLFFLTISVLSKSLIGFYPPFLFISYYAYLFLRKKISKQKFKKNLLKITIQISILLSWYLIMFMVFRKDFWQQHIVESHFKRVTSSIESHFGKKTFYIDLMFGQFANYHWFFLGGLYLIYLFIKKKINHQKIFYAFYLLPWFAFLNLTKTKIFWYLYPSLPQFAFFISIILNSVKKLRIIYYLLLIILLLKVFASNFITKDFFKINYSNFDDYYLTANKSKKSCRDKIYFLIEKNSREAFDTLEKMNLLITTSKWWGNHPSFIYYSNKKVEFVYKKILFEEKFRSSSFGECFVLEEKDIKNDFLINSVSKKIGVLYFLKKL